MDPITAFQVAGTVVTFVEFGRSLLNETRRVYKSPDGSTSQVVKLRSIANDLSAVCDHITESLNESTTSSRSGSDQSLVKICEHCATLKDELQEALKGLEARGDTKFDLARRSVGVAFKSIWSQSKISDLDRRLRQVQSEMQMAVLVSLWEEEKIRGSSRQDYLDRNMGAILASVNRTDQKLDQFMQDLLVKSSHQNSEGTSKRSMLFRDLWKADWRPDRETPRVLDGSPSDEDAGFIEQDVINSLWFHAIGSRDTAIHETYKSTYEWILDYDGSTKFVPWAEGDGDLLYWITGKAGSGKSTLMKYLVHHKSTMLHLQKWAGELPVLFCHFYFWEATTERLPHSREGLIRTLLWQCLEKNPELVRKATPRRWAAYHTLRGWEGPVPEWSLEELQETLQNLASLNNFSFKMVMFIDGLDEFDGDPAALIHWIRDIMTKYKIKLCVGSRPWTTFSDAFEKYPTLTMQALTAPDIKTYINGHLNTHPAFNDWQTLSPDGTEALRLDFVKKADGVFLWVFIVVRELMSALGKGKNLHDLRAILNSLPTGIMNLYTKIYGGADPEEAQRAALYFSLLQVAIHNLTSHELWYIEENELVYFNDIAATIAMQRVIKRRLDSSTRGMVEISKDNFIVFHHRSVHEWLLLPEVMKVFPPHLPKHFDARLVLMKGCRGALVQIYQVDSTSRLSPFGSLSGLLYYASQVPESPVLSPELFRELEMARVICDQIAETIEKRSEGPLRDLANIRAKFHSSMAQRLRIILPAHTRNLVKIQSSVTSTVKADKYEIGHWSFAFRQYRPSARGCFTALLARFAVYPYVMAQVKETPDLLEERSDRISLLHNAIFGPDVDQDNFHVIRPVDHRLRLRLIKALLDSGASARGSIHMYLPELDGRDMDYGRDKYYLDAIRDLPSKYLDRICPQEYWHEVNRLLTESMSRGGRFRRSLSAILDTDP